MKGERLWKKSSAYHAFSVLLNSCCCNTSKTKKEATSDTTTVQETTSAQETTTVAESTIKDTQVIGSDAYGYVKVPKSWIHFTEVRGWWWYSVLWWNGHQHRNPKYF